MAAPVINEFDPLTTFAGAWTTSLAEQYLPLPGDPHRKYECVDGRLYMSPAEGFDNGFVQMMIGRIMGDAAEDADMLIVGQVNLTFAHNRWIVPDALVVSSAPAPGKQRIWVPAEHGVMPIEIVSPSSRDRDYFDKPAICAAAGVPYFMQIAVEHSMGPVTVTLHRLRRRGRPVLIAGAQSGETFTMEEPFPLTFDPARFLAP